MRDRKLTTKQTETLLIAYKFRFITTHNLAKHRNITHNSAYSALEILTDAGYLGRKHNKSYRLQNKPASYYLTPHAVSYLIKSDLNVDKDILKSRFREHAKSLEFIDQQVATHTAYLDITQKLGKSAEIKTGTEMAGIEGMIRPVPSLLVRPKKGKSYFIELTDDQHLFLVKKRIRKYIDHYESDDWEGNEYPNVYIIRKSKVDQRKLKEYIEEKMDDAYLDSDDYSVIVSSSII